MTEATIPFKIEDDNVLFSRGDTPEIEAAHRAFEAQLGHTMNMIKQMETHPHFTDDCGEYLAHALELSSRLQGVRQDGAEALYEMMVEMLKPVPEEWEGRPESEWISDILNYSSDALAPEMLAWAKANGAKDWDDK